MTIITYDRAAEIIESQAKRGLDKKKLGNNTYLLKKDNLFVIQLHRTDVITIHPSDIYELNTGGWQTATTKDRLNEFSPCRISQKRGVWYLADNTVFFDGIRVNKSGEVVNNDSAPDNLLERRKRLDRMISKYIRGFAEDAKENGLKSPGAGDCFYCQLYWWQTVDSQASEDMLHIYSHLQEDYFVPSLLYRAIVERGHGDPKLVYAMIRMDAEKGRDDLLKQCLRSFFSKRKVELAKFVELE